MAPTPGEVYDAIVLPPDAFPLPHTAAMETFLTGFSANWSMGWTTWESLMTGGGLTVTGAGAWTGTGTLGDLVQGAPMGIAFTPLGENHPDYVLFYTSVVDALVSRFTGWAGGYTFTNAAFAGTTTATGSTAGVFTATVVPGMLSAIGSAPAVPPIRPQVEAGLVAAGWVPSKSVFTDLLDAIDGALFALLSLWIGRTQFQLNTVTGPSAAGTGAGTGTSAMNGTLL